MKRFLMAKIVVIMVALAPFATVAAVNLPDFTELVEQTSPAVVHIQTSNLGLSQNNGPSNEEIPEFFRRFFDTPKPQQQRPFGEERRGGGSGFIVDAAGYIVTNHHVIEGAEQILVRLADRREFEAEVIGSDPQSDIALLKVNAKDLPTLALGDSDALKRGQWVIAIGSPFALEQTVTAGIISGMGRSNGQQQYVPFIQTDVAINRGNSGGPLLNLEGEVVGVNSWILTTTGGSIGMSFSIPIEVAANTIDQLREYGRVSRGLLGVGIEGVQRELAGVLKLDRPTGALVNRIEPGSAAEKAGIEVGDVILSYDGTAIDNFTDLPPLVGVTRPGKSVNLLINRWGEQKTISAIVAELPEPEAINANLDSSDNKQSNGLGLTVDPIEDGLRERLGNPEGGVIVREVENAAAWRAGIRPGDVILRINRGKVENMADFSDHAADVGAGDTVALLLLQGGLPNFVAYTPEAGE